MLKQKKLIIALSIIPAILIVKLLAQFPEFVETYYSNGLYPLTSKILRFTLGWLPFSFGDFIYAFAIIFILRWLFVNRKRIIKDFKHWLIDVFAALAIIYIAFHVFWAINYYRLPLHKNLNLKADYTTEELVAVTNKLIDKSNKIQLQITNNDTVKVVFPYTKPQLLKKVPDGYRVLQNTFPHLEYDGKSIKKSLLSMPLTYMGFSGYLNPLTNEAQVNSWIPIFKLPTTASHEVAHQLGYAAENEANFIGFLAATSNTDIYFKYSGYTFALRHCLHEIYRRNPELYTTKLQELNPGILKNYQDVRVFWDSHKNPIEPLFQTTYSSFLEANNQKGGMKSYSYVVALLVNYLQNKTL
ncbi:DUF3810 domain-containing protein [Lacinutrix sp. 5H-3-7-4]|uniref:DUF3810 domain-containing protein n=1 Tax=Lacinutrix sp. (strain 5H-3-7-4) TaxID=983544 RepID=UPI00020A360C|nr:DUF3810 domain-containing protein [Lacinutrix sp. 5H-3-7-4]AEH01698.1 amino acid permease [Lacinutrix sp. 5H-3-7-4]